MKRFNVIVIGDLMLDRYLIGENNRHSPEANVPIINIQDKFEALGGASNVAYNLLDLQINPFLVGVIGDDDVGQKIQELTNEAQIPNAFVKDASRCSTLKTRIIDKNYNQFIRFDEESKSDVNVEVQNLILENLNQLTIDHRIDACIIQDYNKGVITKNTIIQIQKICKDQGIKLLVDPKTNNFELLSNCDIFKPNFKEISDFFNIKELEKTEASIGQKLNESILKAENFIITLAESGIYYQNNDKKGVIVGEALENPDVSGAGDTVISVLTLLLLLDYEISIMAKIANACGAKVCKKRGISTINRAELNEILEKII